MENRIRRAGAAIALLVVVASFVLTDSATAAASTSTSSSTSSSRRSYRLYHVLGEGAAPSPRGRIVIAPPSNADGDGVSGDGGDGGDDGSDGDDGEGGGGLEATYHPEVASSSSSSSLDVEAFDRMVSEGGLYTLRVIAEDPLDLNLNLNLNSDSSSSSSFVASASVPGCSLRRSNLREEVTLSIGPTGALMGVSYRPLVSPLAPPTCERLVPLTERPEAVFRKGDTDGTATSTSPSLPFRTSVSFESHRPMMVVPTVLPQSRPPPGLQWYRRNAKNSPSIFGVKGGGTKDGAATNEAGAQVPPFMEDEQPGGIYNSFFVRYWYVFLPLAIMGLFGGVEEEQNQTGAAAAGAAGAAVAAGAVSGQQQTVQRGQRQRRGKKE